MAVDNKSGKVFVVINFGEDDHYIGEAAVRNPHFLTIDEVVLSIFGEFGCGFSVVGIRSGARLGKAITSFELSRGQARNPLLFLCFISVIQDGQCADSSVCTEADAKRMRSTDGFGNEHGGFEIQPHSSQIFGYGATNESQFSRFFHQLGNESVLLLFDALQVRDDALLDKIQRHLFHHQLLFRPFFWNENSVCCGFAD